jgi:mono/diheme cytochrome c family protein
LSKTDCTRLKLCATAIGAGHRWHKVLALSLVVLSGACRQDMHDQPKATAYKRSDFFADQRSARPLVEGTIARGYLNEDELLYTGRVGGQPATVFPFGVDEALMRRGRERFDIYCSPCHGLTGEGDGMIVQRGYRRPPSFHTDRLRQAPPGHLFDVITSGFGAMPDYAAQIAVRDRWLIAAYIRALQLSQNAAVAQLSPDAQGRLR